MDDSGFHQQQRFSPSGLAIVVTLHAAALAALALVKSPEFILPPPAHTEVEFIPLPTDPPADRPPPPPDAPRDMPPVIDRIPPVIDLPPRGPIVDVGPRIPIPPLGDVGDPVIPQPRIDPPPVRTDAEFDPRFAGDLQPPYPPAEERAQREGSVRIRLTIGADGRVKAVHKLGATSDAFFRATERHALARWRFRPATLDGRPVESSKVMRIFFRIDA